MMKIDRPACLALTSLLLVACSQRDTDTTAAPAPEQAPVATYDIDQSAIMHADSNSEDWLTHGRTWSEQRHSPLRQVNKETVSQLGLVWYADLDTARGQEATPLVIDGKLYTTTAWSHVKAYDAATGEELWSFDPEVPGTTGAKACCDVVNRGLAAWGDKLYLGTLDGRLIALDRETGKTVWDVQTFDPDSYYTITGAPRAMEGLVIIGNGGADMGYSRGFITAYDSETGKLVWRFYTVPDNPANGPQPDYLETATDTWKGSWWEFGGGGTVWDSMAFDPDLGLLYIGVGNGMPWNQQFRSPGGGDNLYLSSIIALDAKSGEYVWHFQTTPGETWDYTATQHIILADLEIGGQSRKVLMQAPKNGFFYVLDRETGEFISANNFDQVTWALGIDAATGRPVENQAARFKDSPALVYPGPGGAHNWHPMAFNPDEQLVYIPAQNRPLTYSTPDTWTIQPIGFNTGTGASKITDATARDGRKVYELQPSQSTDEATVPLPGSFQPVVERETAAGSLVAWDPVSQDERWRVAYAIAGSGGVLSTAGGLVFQGTVDGDFKAYDAGSGAELWSFPVQTGAVAAPITYSIDGTQYVALLAGWGGSAGIHGGLLPNRSRMLVFALHGEAALPDTSDYQPVLDPPKIEADPSQVERGGRMFMTFCRTCHSAGTVLPDLRYSSALNSEKVWTAIVRDGALEARGMVSFRPVMSDDEILAIRHYLIDTAQQDARAQ